MLMNKFLKFAPLFAPEGEGGGGGTEADSSGVGEVTGGDAGVAGAEPSPPAATFLTEKPAGTEEQKPAEGEKVVEEKPAAETPPAFDLAAITLPEGFTLAEETGKAFAELLTNTELTPQERGQKFMDLHTAALKTTAEAVTEQVKQANLEAYKTMNQQWRDQIKDLPEFKKNPEAEAGKLMQALISLGAGDDFFKAIDLTGAGNHPAILQVLHKLASPHFEGTAVTGAVKDAGKRPLGSNIYTSANKA